MAAGAASIREGCLVPLRLVLLDGFLLIRAGIPVIPPMALQRVLAFLALHPGASRVHAAALLWPEVPEGRAQGCLRTALWRLRQLHAGILESERPAIRLGAHVRVDVAELMRVAHLVQSGGNPQAADVLLTMGRAELLPGWYDDWVLTERECLRQLRFHALEEACRAYLRLGEYGRALQSAIAAMRAEPLRETPHRLMIEVHLSEGNVSEALRLYHAFHNRVRGELGLTPSVEMQDLLTRALRLGLGGDGSSWSTPVIT
jgi:DNA-binding SARP family transcriptional activator